MHSAGRRLVAHSVVVAGRHGRTVDGGRALVGSQARAFFSKADDDDKKDVAGKEEPEREESISEWWARINSKEYQEGDSDDESDAKLKQQQQQQEEEDMEKKQDEESESSGGFVSSWFSSGDDKTEVEDTEKESTATDTTDADTDAAIPPEAAPPVEEDAREPDVDAEAARATDPSDSSSSSSSSTKSKFSSWFSSDSDDTSSSTAKDSSESSDSGAGAGAGGGAEDDAATSAADPDKPSAFKKLTSSVTGAADVTASVVAGVFGVKRELKSEKEARAKREDVEVNLDDSEMMVIDPKKNRWDQIAEALQVAPLIESIMNLRAAIADSEVGAAAGKAKEKIDDTAQTLQEKWDTSQHPLVYNASAAYDGLFGENEWAQAVAAIRRMDPSFDMPTFVEEMRDTIIPDVVKAFLVGNQKDLGRWCTESAMAQIGSVLRAREAEGLSMDPNILSISNVDIAAAKVTEKTPPVLVVSCMVQQINCMTNAKGEVVEGNEDEIRAVFYVFAMLRDYEAESASLHWRVAEMSMIGSQLYL